MATTLLLSIHSLLVHHPSSPPPMVGGHPSLAGMLTSSVAWNARTMSERQQGEDKEKNNDKSRQVMAIRRRGPREVPGENTVGRLASFRSAFRVVAASLPHQHPIFAWVDEVCSGV
ncbi:Os05g0344300 [Oryza sativa Japonica Group]|uniref:Os05g0344300 protein n=1 Tax=Oryza sativa subsp. japonica TaxID=39947 RepID=A0A0P0WL16_ORYSJ|nr:Os05g0344300 [Oryza sativa Japonica Group]